MSSLLPELRAVAALALPVVVGQLAFTALNLEGVWVAGQLGGQALAAVSVGNIWSFGVLIFGLGAAMGLDSVFAQANGAGDQQAQHRALGHALLGIGALSVPLVALHGLTGPALRLLGQPAEVVPAAAAYGQALAWGVPPLLLAFALRSYLHGLGLTRPAAVVLVGSNLINVVAGLGLGLGRWGLPGLGPEGIGLATSLARGFMLVGLLAVSAELRAGLRGALGHLHPTGAWRLLGVVLPVGVQVALEVEAFNLVGLMMGWISAEALAANGLILGICSVSFMVPLGLGAAGATRVGNLLGAGRPWAPTAWLVIGLAAGVMALSALGLSVAGERLLGLWTTDAEVLAVAVIILPMAAAFQVFDGIQAACFGVLRGAGDLRLPALANVVGYWVVGLPVGAWLGFGLGGSVRGVWSGLVLALVLVAGLLLWRVRQVAAAGGRRVVVQ